MPDVQSDVRAAEERIREKYARRKTRDSRYSWFNAGHVFMAQDRERWVIEMLKRSGVDSLEDKRVLDVGCGDGSWLREFVKWGALPENLVGVDLLPERVERARHLSPQSVTLLCGSAAKLDFPSDSFDIVLQSTVFTSMQDRELKQRVAKEMLRVVRPRGLILWYDFRVNNPSNPDVSGVGRKELLALFTGCDVDLSRVTLAPPLVRYVARWSWLACYLLTKIPWLRAFYVAAISKV